VVLEAIHENGDWRLCADIDDARQLPLFEGEWRQLIPAVTGDRAAVIEGAGRWYFEFHFGWHSINLRLVWFTFGQAET